MSDIKPTYKVELIATPWKEVIDQLLSDSVEQVAGPSGVEEHVIQDQSISALRPIGKRYNEEMVINCNTLTGWTFYSANGPALNTSSFTQRNASIDFGLYTAFPAFIDYVMAEHTLSSVDMSGGKEFLFDLKFGSTGYARLASTYCVKVLCFSSTSPERYYQKTYDKADVIEGRYITLGGDITTWLAYNSPNASSIIKLRVIITIADMYGGSIPSGEFNFDNFRLATPRLIVEEFDSLTGWTYEWGASAPTLGNTPTTRLHGTNFINCGKTSTSEAFARYKKDYSPVLSSSLGKWFNVNVYITDKTKYTTSGSAVAIQFTRVAGGGGSNKSVAWTQAELVNGWNTKRIYNDNTGLEQIGYIEVVFGANAPTTVIPHGDFKVDWHWMDDWSDNEVDYIGQSFKLPKTGMLKSITFNSAVYNYPVDNLKCELRSSSDTLLATSTNQQTPASSTPFTFNFTPYYMIADTEYRFYLVRTGTSECDNYWTVKQKDSDVYLDGNLRKATLTGQTYAWSDETGYDLEFDILYETVKEKIGQSFILKFFDAELIKVSVWLTKYGSAPTLYMRLYDIDGILLFTSPDVATASGMKVFTFNYPLEEGETYIFAVDVGAGTPSATNYWTISKKATTNPFADGSLFIYEEGAWIISPTDDLKFSIERNNTFDPIDLTNDVLAISFNYGRNDIDGVFERGAGDILLKNRDGKYTPSNTSSPLYGLFRVYHRIGITAVFDTIEYNLFYAYIKEIKPNLPFEQRTVNVYLEDRFYPFSNSKVSIGAQSNKTADELIELLLTALSLNPSEFDLEEDSETLESVTWNDVSALEKLNECVEVGQHHHFISPDGKYVFKNNQWLSSNIPVFIIEENDGKARTAYFSDKHEGIKNKIQVKWGSSFKISENNLSQAMYGLKEYFLENELMPSVDDIYAGIIGQYVLALFKDPGGEFSFSIINLFPECISLKLGDVIQFISAYYGIDEVYSILAITQRIDTNTGQHEASFKTRKWIEPPNTANLIAFEPFEGDAWIDIWTAFHKWSYFVGESFKITGNNYKIRSVSIVIQNQISYDSVVSIELYAADGQGKPTGSKLATSNTINFQKGTNNGTYEFVFSELQRPVLTNGSSYCWVIKTDLYQIGTYETLDPFVPDTFYTPFPTPAGTWIEASQTFRWTNVVDIWYAKATCGSNGGIPLNTLMNIIESDPVAQIPPYNNIGITYTKENIVQAYKEYEIYSKAFDNRYLPMVPSKAYATDFYVTFYDWGEAHRFQIKGKAGNPYSLGKGARRLQSDWHWYEFSLGVDFGFYVQGKILENRWKFWGKNSDIYADGNALIKNIDTELWSYFTNRDLYFLIKYQIVP